MKRKIIKLGSATLVTSLPSKWTKRQSLSQGDELDIEESEDQLVISPGKVSIKKTETSMDLTNETESSVRTLVTNAYRLGIDKLTITFKSEKQYIALKNTVKTRLIGFDIIKKEKNHCIIENLTEPSVEQFDTLLQKMLFNISELLLATKERIEKGKSSSDYEEFEENIQQYDNFCKRVISKKKSSIKKTELFWLFLTLIVHGQREIYLMNKYIDKNTKKINAHLIDECISSFELIKKAYLKKDITPLEQLHEKEKETIYNKAHKLFETKKGKESVINYHVTSAIRQFYLAASPLMGLMIN